jgi:hypothetical protein
MENRIGLYQDISHSVYHSIEAVSNSYLSRLQRCPAAAKIPHEETPAMIFGRAFHCLILEGMEVFNRECAIAPNVDKRTKIGKEVFAEFQQVNEGKTIVSGEDYDTMIDMANAVIKHPFGVKCLAEGRSEISIFWNDPLTGLYCKCRPDRIPDGDHGVIVDVKTTRDSDKRAFAYTVLRMSYDMQAAIYVDGLNAVCSSKVDAFVFISVEKEPPYRVECYTLSEGDIDVGRFKYRELMKIEQICRQRGEWPNYLIDETGEPMNGGLTELWMPATY